VQQKNKNEKKGVALNGCRSIFNATTNQKHAVVTEERKARRFDRGGAWGKRDYIFLVAKESGGM
jgi:hypothetical protein